MLFLFMTAPVSAHLLAKAALHLGVPSKTRLPHKKADDAGWSGAERASKPSEARPGAARTRGAEHRAP